MIFLTKAIPSFVSHVLIFFLAILSFLVMIDRECQDISKQANSTLIKTRSFTPHTATNKHFNSTLSNEEDIINFAIIGFPKCSTTFLRNRLLHTRQFFYGSNRMEMHHLRNNNVQELMDLFSNVSDPHIKKKGFKCPDVLYSNNALSNLQTYFPSADLVVVVRHPVLWFQSFYNYRVRNGYKMAPPTDLMGSCSTQDEGILDPWNTTTETMFPAHKVCTDRANFHIALSRLGKTPMTSVSELDLLHNHSLPIHPSRNRVFIMELGQLSIENKTRARQLVNDLESFLGLDEKVGDIPLPKLKRHRPKHGIATNVNESILEEKLMDICLPTYDELRSVLVTIGRSASEWIISYFVESPEVFVSDKSRFESLLKVWGRDPCNITDNQNITS